MKQIILNSYTNKIEIILIFSRLKLYPNQIILKFTIQNIVKETESKIKRIKETEYLVIFFF